MSTSDPAEVERRAAERLAEQDRQTRTVEQAVVTDTTCSAEVAYLLRSNITYPGSPTQRVADEQAAREQIRDRHGELGAAITSSKTITPAND